MTAILEKGSIHPVLLTQLQPGAYASRKPNVSTEVELRVRNVADIRDDQTVQIEVRVHERRTFPTPGSSHQRIRTNSSGTSMSLDAATAEALAAELTRHRPDITGELIDAAHAYLNAPAGSGAKALVERADARIKLAAVLAKAGRP